MNKVKHMINWLVKYDERFKGNREKAKGYILQRGEEVLYKEGLNNAEPLDESEDISKNTIVINNKE